MIDKIWDGDKPYIIAEVSQNHDGSLGQAHAFIDAVSTTGADAIKFQTHIAEEESSIYEPFRQNFSYEDVTRYDYWKRMEFTNNQWKGLYEHANEVGLDFLSSPFSEKAFELLDSIGVSAWKLGAGEVFNERLLKRAVDTGKPILLSTGLSTLDDIDGQIRLIKNSGNKYVVFQCVTAYPSSAEMIDISQISLLKERFKCVVGISDHSSTIYPSLAAITLGAKVVEVHVTMSPYMFGPDVKASVTMEQLKEIVEGASFIKKMLHTEDDLNVRSETKEHLKKMFSKSIYASRDIKAGEVLSAEMVKLKKPNIGIDSRELNAVLGKTVVKKIASGDIIRWESIKS